jgi:hypothetical protein
MPNRGELAGPTRRPSTVAAAVPADAWPVVGFCALGFLMSIALAVSSFGAILPRLLDQ